MPGSYTISPAPNTEVRLIAIINSSGPTQQIVITPNGSGPPAPFTALGSQQNYNPGQYVVDPTDGVTQITISMSYDNLDGSGFHDSDVAGSVNVVSNTTGFATVSGSDSGPSVRSNTIVFAYWSKTP